MSPVPFDHERDKSLVTGMIWSFCSARRVPLDASGNLTLWRDEWQVAVEPDASFYVQTPPPHDAGFIDLALHAPPDLAIEIEHSRSAIDKELIYCELGVPELWRWDGQTLRIRTLRGDRTGYDANEVSRLLPALPVEAFVAHLRRAGAERQSDILRSWQASITQGR